MRNRGRVPTLAADGGLHEICRARRSVDARARCPCRPGGSAESPRRMHQVRTGWRHRRPLCRWTPAEGRARGLCPRDLPAPSVRAGSEREGRKPQQNRGASSPAAAGAHEPVRGTWSRSAHDPSPEPGAGEPVRGSRVRLRERPPRSTGPAGAAMGSAPAGARWRGLRTRRLVPHALTSHSVRHRGHWWTTRLSVLIRSSSETGSCSIAGLGKSRSGASTLRK